MVGTEQAKQERQKRTGRIGKRDSIGRSGQPEKDGQDRAARRGQPE
jgi:hypothetical protein